jgi:chemotaxis signal transduction protein
LSTLHVRVTVASEAHALPVEDVLEVAEVGEITPLPGASAAIVGVWNMRGQVVPVVDLAAVLGLRGAHSPERLVIVEHAQLTAALAVDRIVGVEDLPDVPEEIDSPHLARATLFDGELVGVLDVGSVLGAVAGTPAR